MEKCCLKTVCFRGGCITGPNHSGASLHGFLSYLVKASLNYKKYNLIGYKGKQVRDNLHSLDLVNCFGNFIRNQSMVKFIILVEADILIAQLLKL